MVLHHRMGASEYVCSVLGAHVLPVSHTREQAITVTHLLGYHRAEI